MAAPQPQEEEGESLSTSPMPPMSSSSWAGPETTSVAASGRDGIKAAQQRRQEPFFALVVDSGAIVKSSTDIITKLRGVARHYVCPYGVLDEIRDSRSRQALQQAQTLLDLKPRHPTPASIERVIAFSKLTGDYPSLSTVDVHVLALTLDMEREGCFKTNGSSGSNGRVAVTASESSDRLEMLHHIRTTPKRTLGLGKITKLHNMNKNQSKDGSPQPPPSSSVAADNVEAKTDGESTHNNDITIARAGNHQGLPSMDDGLFILDDDDFDDDDDEDDNDSHDSDEDDECDDSKKDEAEEGNGVKDEVYYAPASASTIAASAPMSVPAPASAVTTAPPRSWAALVNPTVASAAVVDSNHVAIASTFQSTKAANAAVPNSVGNNSGTCDGQFDDAEQDDHETICHSVQEIVVEAELENEFPSLAAASKVLIQEDDDVIGSSGPGNFIEDNGDLKIGDRAHDDGKNNDSTSNHDLFGRTEEEKLRNLQPISKSGRLYNTLGKYKKLAVSSKRKVEVPTQTLKSNEGKANELKEQDTSLKSSSMNRARTSSIQDHKNQKTKILTTSLAESMEENDDDGEGWITSVPDIRSSSMNLGGGGGTNIKRSNNNFSLTPEDESEQQNSQRTTTNATATAVTLLPPRSSRAACTTTDFAMQNVLLQMNLLLWSAVDGMEIKRLKTWVIRCGVCFKVHPADDQFEGRIKRMFCTHCGSGDLMQRVSASVDGKTGRLKLHFSRKSAIRQKHANARGTKFSLPKPGTHNRFQGDLLLREDQLLMGAWNQKLKIKTGGKQSREKAESIFGKDLAGSIGCTLNANNPDDIRVGFGTPRRHNPNAAKGRERRGKKKKSSDRACGMRRY